MVRYYGIDTHLWSSRANRHVAQPIQGMLDSLSHEIMPTFKNTPPREWT